MELKNQIISDIEYLPKQALRAVSAVIKEFIAMSAATQTTMPDEEVMALSCRLMEQNKEAYEVLAK